MRSFRRAVQSQLKALAWAAPMDTWKCSTSELLEHRAFLKAGMLFLGVHVVNGNVPSPDEFSRRNYHNYLWVRAMFNNFYNDDSVQAAVIFGNARPGRAQNQDFFDQMVALLDAIDASNPVLYVHAAELANSDQAVVNKKYEH